MEEAIEIDMGDTLAEALRRRKGTKKPAKRKTNKNKPPPPEPPSVGESPPENTSTSPELPQNSADKIRVSLFDYSVENHFKDVEMISKLCGEGEADFQFDPIHIKRLSSSITFLREWRYFNYQSRILRFTCQNESAPEKDVIGEINLPQFSSATVPKKDQQSGSTIPTESSKDFVMYVGGSVWALDWCPTFNHKPDTDVKTEYIAVAAHAPESSYHKIGAALTGRGMIQIWCLLNFNVKEENVLSRVQSIKPLKQRGRPRKIPLSESEDHVPIKSQDYEAAADQLLDNSLEMVPNNGASGHTEGFFAKRYSVRKRKSSGPVVSADASQYSNDLNQDSSESETIKTKPCALKKAGGRPKKKQNQYEPFVVQSTENLSSVPHRHEVSGTMNGQVATRESDKIQRDSDQVVAVQLSQSPCNNEIDEVKLLKPKKTQVRPKKNTKVVDEPQSTQALGIQSSCLIPIKEVSGTIQQEVAKKETGRKQKVSSQVLATEAKQRYTSNVDPIGHLRGNVARSGLLEKSPARSSKDVVLPRAVLCLAHNGKVAWDVKWQPANAHDAKSTHRMGYLAVLLGNGALEVWEVPSPRAVKVIYSASQKEGTDPRFVKLDPVFRCSMLKCGDRQSMPLTLEWSASPPHDLILAGCHDGVVVLWKFSATISPKDTRPLLCFSADTVPIRALAWAPVNSDLESANIFVTGGHKGLKFWDIRDPFRPLWDLNPVQRVICSLDWLPDPRCIIVSYDDGTIRILSLSKAAYDVPVTGKPFVGTQQQGLHSYYCSSYTIWSVQVSRLTGMVAYCSADGTVLSFQLTTRAVEKDPLRNRVPHFLCGSLTEEDSTLTMYTPLPDIPFPMKKSLNEWATAPRTIRGFLSVSNQEKRAKEAKGQTSNQQTLALCYGDDPGIDSGSDDMMVEETSKKASKSKTSSKKKTKADQALVFRGDDSEPVQGEDGELGVETEVLPPKVIAMHKVRWNMNKGSQRWLCYGGASGILRCQEINPSGF